MTSGKQQQQTDGQTDSKGPESHDESEGEQPLTGGKGSTSCLHKSKRTCVRVGVGVENKSAFARSGSGGCCSALCPPVVDWFPLRLTCYPSRIRIEESSGEPSSSDQQSNMRCKVASSSRAPSGGARAKGGRGRQKVPTHSEVAGRRQQKRAGPDRAQGRANRGAQRRGQRC